MRKAFTLIELLIVVVILVTLMGMVFRLGNISSDSNKRAVTIQRMQRVENAISGYYAAFGMYPPVRLHGKRNIYLAASNGVQDSDGRENTAIWGWLNGDGTAVKDGNKEYTAWGQVEAACRSQPVACEFPFPEGWRETVRMASEEMQEWAEKSENMTAEDRRICAAGFDDGVTDNIGRHQAKRGEIEWTEIQLFRFGLMSYLLPRYLVMMNGDTSFFTDYAQWTGNNTNVKNPLTGADMNWADIANLMGTMNDPQKSDAQKAEARKEIMKKIANVPSQAVCARWMANFEGLLSCNQDLVLFGVSVTGDQTYTLPVWDEASGSISGNIYNPINGMSGGTSGNYVLDCITVKDGWDTDFFYYSPQPYQSYVFWSAGENKKTFPPWMAREKLSPEAAKCAAYWTKDDIVGLKN